MEYARSEARGWAKEKFQGLHNVTMPTFTADLKSLNESAIRFDVEESAKQGFFATLLSSECGTSKEEMKKFIELAVDTGRRKIRLTLHASFDTLEDTLEMVRYAEEAGCHAVLLSYPPMFYPETELEIFRFTQKVCDTTNLGVIMFLSNSWGFDRFHPSGFPLDLLKKIIAIPNIIAVKYSLPNVAYFHEVAKVCRGKVLVSDPKEPYWPAWIELYEMQWGGTSNYEYMQGAVEYFDLLRKGEREKGLEIYWRLNPAREVTMEHLLHVLPTGLHHRLLWKYQGWLVGFNGGPLRTPVMRLNKPLMNKFRRALEASGIRPTKDDDARFFVGRNPT
ncbi:MAG: dihydrodipicolinate synthase family protein [Thaumarchaeota archaeon]|nr:MAG: dihydrodipicolinate synthase family protein [Nitrososphaerota archaeon]TLY14271.1 MAG: dihydrodipicolinate synthase family protein [Nitrososphaerota archaeon]TMQ01389.1 MAG: dihydrodipicolinate synthase family protein [Nitrososphaerota archaeon]